MHERNESVVYEFADFTVDAVRRHLLRNREPVPLTTKAFDTLLILIQQRGETVSKAELMNAVWGDTAVEENNLTQQISTLRKVFGERPAEHRFILTVPGRGYSFIAEVKQVEHEDRPVPQPARMWVKYLSYPPLLVVVSLSLIFIIGMFAVNVRRSISRPSAPTITVLPFTSADGTDDSLGVGIRYTLTAKLGNLQDILNVRPTDSTVNYTSQDPIVAGRALDVDAVLDGNIQHQGDQIRVTVRMLDVAGGRVIWGKSFDAANADNFSMQDLIAAEVVQGIKEYYARD